MSFAAQTSHQTRGHLATGLLCLATGTLVGVLATTAFAEEPAGRVAVAQSAPTDPADPTRFGWPGHVTMSADSIERWIAAGRLRDPADPGRFGYPGHVTMSADSIERWIAAGRP